MTPAVGCSSSHAPCGQGGALRVPIREEGLREALLQTSCDPNPPDILHHQHHGQLRDAPRDAAAARLPVHPVSRSGTTGSNRRRGLWGVPALSSGQQRPGQYHMDSLRSYVIDLMRRNWAFCLFLFFNPNDSGFFNFTGWWRQKVTWLHCRAC